MLDGKVSTPCEPGDDAREAMARSPGTDVQYDTCTGHGSVSPTRGGLRPFLDLLRLLG